MERDRTSSIHITMAGMIAVCLPSMHMSNTRSLELTNQVHEIKQVSRRRTPCYSLSVLTLGQQGSTMGVISQADSKTYIGYALVKIARRLADLLSKDPSIFTSSNQQSSRKQRTPPQHDTQHATKGCVQLSIHYANLSYNLRLGQFLLRHDAVDTSLRCIPFGYCRIIALLYVNVCTYTWGQQANKITPFFKDASLVALLMCAIKIVL